MKKSLISFNFYTYIFLIIGAVVFLAICNYSPITEADTTTKRILKPNRAYKIPVKSMNPQEAFNPTKIKNSMRANALGYPKEFLDFINVRRKKIKESGSQRVRRDNRLLEPERFSQLSYSAKQYFKYRAKRLAKLPKPNTTKAIQDIFTNQQQAANNENILVNIPSQDLGNTKTQNETSVAAFGNTIAVSFNDAAGIERRNVAGVAVSQDGGTSWKQSFLPSVGGFNLGDGVLGVDTKGNFYYAMIGLDFNNRSLIAVSRSTNGGKTWLRPVDASTTAGGIDDFQDKEWLAVDRSAKSRFKDNVYVSWTKFPFSGVPKIMFAASNKRGKKFQKPIVIAESISNDSAIQGSMIATGPNGEVYVVWSDRSLVGVFSTVLIRLSKSTDGGKTFSEPTTIASFTNPAFPSNGVFSGNAFPSIAVDISNSANQGNIYVVFSGRLDNREDRAEVLLVTSKDGGATWSNLTKLNDDNSLADQILPSIAVADDGAVAASWYDRRNDLTNLSLLDVYATVSTDGGNSFSANQRITNANWPLIPTPLELRAGYHGDYSQLSTIGDKFLFNWGDDRNGIDTDVYLAIKSASEIADPTKAGFIISAKDSSKVTKPGGLTSFFIDRKILSGDSNFTFTATSNTPNLSFDFSNDSLEGFELQVRATASIAPGPYFITVNAQRGDLVRSTAVRLTVLENNPLVKEQQNITNNASGSILPASFIDEQGNINVAWLDDSPGIFAIFFTRSTDNGKTFSTPVMIPRRETFIGQPIVLANKQDIYIVHLELIDNPNFIFMTQILRSTDQGKSFTLINSLNEPDIFIASETAQIDIDGTIHIAASTLNPENPASPTFAAIDLRSTDGGKTFTPSKIFESTAPVSNPILVIEGDGKTVRSILIDFSRQQGGLLITQSNNGGLSYDPPTKVTDKIDDLISATLFFTTDKTHFILNRGSFLTEQFQLFYTNSNKDGQFTTPKAISGNVKTVLSGSLAADDEGNVLVAFEGSLGQLSDMDFSTKIFYCNSTDGGTNFSTLKSFEPVGGDDFAPLVLLDLKQSYSILWQGISQGVLDNFYSISTDKGKTFPTQVNLSHNSGISVYADLSFDIDGRIQLISQDNTGGSFDIFRTKLGGD
ncbi:MAG: exo-alpha-sialidase [Blastocatellia bacterium]|nr:exo-alpha-sialidase [Blastocatellia bacterium]